MIWIIPLVASRIIIFLILFHLGRSGGNRIFILSPSVTFDQFLQIAKSGRILEETVPVRGTRRVHAQCGDEHIDCQRWAI